VHCHTPPGHIACAELVFFIRHNTALMGHLVGDRRHLIPGRIACTDLVFLHLAQCKEQDVPETACLVPASLLAVTIEVVDLFLL